MNQLTWHTNSVGVQVGGDTVADILGDRAVWQVTSFPVDTPASRKRHGGDLICSPPKSAKRRRDRHVRFCVRRRRSPFGYQSNYFRRHRAGARGCDVSRFTQTMFDNAQSSLKGMNTGEPDAPVRHTWGEVHERSRHVAGGLAAAGVGHGDAVAVLAGRARRDRPDRAGHLDARCQPHHAAPAHAAHRPATMGRRDHGCDQHDRRQGRRGLRSVHGRGTAAFPAGNAGR